jgi:hypothetical protein
MKNAIKISHLERTTDRFSMVATRSPRTVAAVEDWLGG